MDKNNAHKKQDNKNESTKSKKKNKLKRINGKKLLALTLVFGLVFSAVAGSVGYIISYNQQQKAYEQMMEEAIKQA